MRTEGNHDGAELFDLHFLHGGENVAWCCICRESVEIGEPEECGSQLARLHRIECGWLA